MSIGFIRITHVVAVGLLLSIGAFFIACGDKPTEPKPVKDYPVYFAKTYNSNLIMRFWPAARRIDTLYAADSWEVIRDIAVSPDNRYLYLLNDDSV